MFTGLIEGLCKIKSASRAGGGSMRISVDLGDLAEGCKAGDSIAVSGVCLTITKIAGNVADFDISGETLAKSTVGSLRAESLVNIERSIAADGQFRRAFCFGPRRWNCYSKKY